MEQQQDSFPVTTTTTTTTLKQPHLAVCPSAGMGHLTPYLSLAASLSSAPYNCHVTLVVIVPIITAAEDNQISSFFTSHPHINRLNFHVELASPKPNVNVDPFFLRYDSITRSGRHLARRLAAVSPPVSAVFSDLLFTEGLNTTLSNPFPNYTVTTTSARFFSVMAYLPHHLTKPVEIPGLGPFQTENIPPPFFDPDHFFTAFTISNTRHLPRSKGIIVNTFGSFEPETLSAIKSGRALPDLPPVFAIGPLCPTENNKTSQHELLSWLDEQPENSVVYVSFGNRTAMSKDQIRELGLGLERSGRGFLWVVKGSMIDKEEAEELGDLLGQELHEKLCKKGKVVKQWVSQREILGHKAVGGFVSHCGWNSVMEAAWFGVPVVAWPQHGDQRENAGVVEKAGLGVWERGWGGGKVVPAVEIAEKVELLMGNEGLRKSATMVGAEAKMACGDGGSSTAAMMSIVGSLKH